MTKTPSNSRMACRNPQHIDCAGWKLACLPQAFSVDVVVPDGPFPYTVFRSGQTDSFQTATTVQLPAFQTPSK